jgi:hypothetical protein
MTINVPMRLVQEAAKSALSQKHAAVVVYKGRIISPMFHNGIRSYVSNVKIGSIHAEMAAVHHVVKGTLNQNSKKSDSYVLCGYQ